VFLELCRTSSRFGIRREFKDQITKQSFLYFEPFLAKMAFLVLKKLVIHYTVQYTVRQEIFFLKIGHYR
jgi:hypothetical protein